MNFPKSMLAIAALSSALLVGCSQNKPENQETTKFDPLPLGIGWNLGNQLDCCKSDGPVDETSWGNNRASRQLIDSVKAAGFQTVRIPITWMNHFSDDIERRIDTAFMDRVAEIVGWCEEAGLKAIINIHHDGADSHNWVNIKQAALRESANDSIKTQLKNVWRQIAERFKDKGDFLVFETLNEIHDGGWGWGDNLKDGGKQYAILNSWNQVIVDEIRSTGANNKTRWIGVPGYVTNHNLTLQHFVLPKDSANKLLLAVHYYDPNKYTLDNEFTEWGKDADTSKCAKYGSEADMDTVFNKLEQKYVKNNLPVYIGEFGCVRRDNDHDEAFRIYYLETLARTAKKHNLNIVYWDNGYSGAGREMSGFFDRATGEYFNDSKLVVSKMVGAYKEK